MRPNDLPSLLKLSNASPGQHVLMVITVDILWVAKCFAANLICSQPWIVDDGLLHLTGQAIHSQISGGELAELTLNKGADHWVSCLICSNGSGVELIPQCRDVPVSELVLSLDLLSFLW